MRTSSRGHAVALVGAGEFGATFVAQARRVPDLDVRLVCDRDPQRAGAALRRAGYAPDEIAECRTRAEALAALERGAAAVIDDLALMADLPIRAVVEATGDPEAAAATAEQARASGCHIALATKEAEVVVGPILARRARAAGLVHTPVDGDQPSLLLGLVARARLLGLPVIAAGKSTESDYVYDPERGILSCWGRSLEVPGYARLFRGGTGLRDVVAERPVASLETATVPDRCEMAIVANHSDLEPDHPEFHAPVARVRELPDLFRPYGQGGLLERTGVVDVFTCLRRPDELSFAGGVFVVVEAPDPDTGHFLAGKGIPGSDDGRTLLLHNPVHLLGVEAPASLLAALRLGRGTGGEDVRPRFDLVARANRNLAPGEALDLGPRHTLPMADPLVLPARTLGPDAPVPYYVAAGGRIRRPVPRGRILTLDDVEVDEGRALTRLRRAQDASFAAALGAQA